MKLEEEKIRAKQKLEVERLRRRKSTGEEEVSVNLLEDGYPSEELEEEYEDGDIGAIKANFKKKKEQAKKRSRDEEEAERKIMNSKREKIEEEEELNVKRKSHKRIVSD
jgi:hypothetical protein